MKIVFCPLPFLNSGLLTLIHAYILLKPYEVEIEIELGPDLAPHHAKLSHDLLVRFLCEAPCEADAFSENSTKSQIF